MKDDGRNIALATSGKKQESASLQEIAEIEDLVDCEMTADDADHSKPEPDLFASSLHKLGDLEGKDVIAVGDTPVRCGSGRQSGNQNSWTLVRRVHVKRIFVPVERWRFIAIRATSSITTRRQRSILNLRRWRDRSAAAESRGGSLEQRFRRRLYRAAFQRRDRFVQRLE